jgi:fimbrial chaperone protein
MLRPFLFLGAIFALMAALPARAASLVLWPIDPVITASERSAALWVENRGSDQVVLQVRTLAWHQSGTEDQLTDQDDVVASPPIARIAPGQRQLIRIFRRAAPSGPGEKSYRLLIDELPTPARSEQKQAASAQLAVQMRYSLPLFTYGDDRNAGAPVLQARIRMEAGRSYIMFSNVGTRHARLLNLRSAAGGEPLIPGLLGYVLPGQSMRWMLPERSSPPATFRINVNGVDQIMAPGV